MFFCLEVRVENVHCEIWLNDMPIVKRGLQYGLRFDAPINQYLIEGTNEICLRISPPREQEKDDLAAFIEEVDYIHQPIDESTEITDEEKVNAATAASAPLSDDRWFGSVPPDAKISVEIVEYPYGAIVGGPDGVKRAGMTWTATDGNAGAMWPMHQTSSFEIREGLPTMVWQDAEVLDLEDPEIRQGAMQLLADLHAALATKDFSKWIELHAKRLDDFDHAYQGKPGTRRARARKELLEEEKEGFTMAPLNPDQSGWRLVAESRLIECCAGDGYPNIREERGKDGTMDSYPVLAGRIDGRWYALR